MTDLEQQVLKYQEQYYNEQSDISDAQFDSLWDRLEKEQPDSELLQKVGEDNDGGFPKAKHILHMNSQAKVNKLEALIKWMKKYNQKELMAQYKMDGISIELQYKTGKLVKAVTRGDGEVGDDITENVRLMDGVPKTLDDKVDVAVRGEIMLAKTIFEDRFAAYKNPRNMASGIAKQKSGNDSQYLTVICYNANWYGNSTESHSFDTEMGIFNFLNYNGFRTVYCFRVEEFEPNRYEVYNLTDTAQAGSVSLEVFLDNLNDGRDKLEFGIDGLVFKSMNIDWKDQERKRPNKQIAFKFEAEEAITKVIDVEWRMNGHNITPVAKLQPVELMGTTVQHASLANPNLIKELGLKIGDEVVITKRGDIIPKIERIYLEDPDGRVPSAPIFVSYEDEAYSVTNEGTRVYVADENFPPRQLHRITKWINALGIKEFGPALINFLFDEMNVRSIAELYEDTLIERVLKKHNLQKATKKAFKNLYSVKEIPLEVFISGFDIEGVGKKVVKRIVDAGIVKNFYEWRDMETQTQFRELLKLEGFQSTSASNLVEGIFDLDSAMMAVLDTGKIKIKEKVKMADGLNGQSFCFTGKLENMKRADAQEMVENKNGVVKSSVGKGLDYLVTNSPDSGSAKNQKAADLGVKLITENEFSLMLMKC